MEKKITCTKVGFTFGTGIDYSSSSKRNEMQKQLRVSRNSRTLKHGDVLRIVDLIYVIVGIHEESGLIWILNFDGSFMCTNPEIAANPFVAWF